MVTLQDFGNQAPHLMPTGAVATGAYQVVPDPWNELLSMPNPYLEFGTNKISRERITKQPIFIRSQENIASYT